MMEFSIICPLIVKLRAFQFMSTQNSGLEKRLAILSTWKYVIPMLKEAHRILRNILSIHGL